MNKSAPLRSVPAIKVHQWLKDWDKIKFDARHHRKKPRPHFYLFTLPAPELRSLCGISRRQTSGMRARAADLGIQRQHDPGRSDEINRFIEYGYPWSTLSETKREAGEYHDLRKPGWLPTAIVVNILERNEAREGRQIAADDLIEVRDNGERCSVILPYPQWSLGWQPVSIPPLEVIDGQHRLWAFDAQSGAENYELPVVAFHGLDISWQAYLFWTINIKPKRINASLAFDLYPLLRAEDWLERAEGHAIYRETRSQELTEALWSHPESPWYDRINMLGEPRNPWVSQAAWIRSLMATFVRPWEKRRDKTGGLFGSRLGAGEEVLGWSRAQQAAFLIFAWKQLYLEIHDSNRPWAQALRAEPPTAEETRDLLAEAGHARAKLRSPRDDAAFYGQHTLIVTDQGVRGFLHVLNDLCFTWAPRLDLRSWETTPRAAAGDEDAVTSALRSLTSHTIASFLKSSAAGLSSFDWRTSAAKGLSEEERRQKLVFRGSGGYRELRLQLLEHLQQMPDDVGQAAKRLLPATQ